MFLYLLCFHNAFSPLGECPAVLCLFDRDTWALGTHSNNLVISHLKVLSHVSRLCSDKVPLPESRFSSPWEHATGWVTGGIQLI